ncbi:MAG: hypothetical protein ACT6FE_03895 [Methanosarcinaceae archaeon]
MNNSEVLRGGTSLKKSIEIDFEKFCGDAPDNDYIMRGINKRLGGKYGVEVFEEELNFIESHQICDDVTGGHFHSLQVCVKVHRGCMHIRTCG